MSLPGPGRDLGVCSAVVLYRTAAAAAAAAETADAGADICLLIRQYDTLLCIATSSSK